MFGMFRKKEIVERNDPVFGHLEFETNDGVDMWCHLPSGEGDHMVLVIAPSTGPTQAQRDFYTFLRNELPLRESECKAFIAAQESLPPNLSEMTIYSVEIGPEEELDAHQFVIELSDSDAYEIHRVEFRNGRPETYGIDD